MTQDTTSKYGWNKTLGVPLLAKLKSDLKASMLNKDEAVKSAIRVIMSEFPRLTVPLRLESGKKTTRPKTAEEITNDDILDIIRSLLKSEKTTLELKEEETSDYLEVLTLYLPQMAGREEISAWIDENIDFSQFKSPMQAMKLIMQHFGKLADGSLVKEILQQRAGQ